ncbi:MAG: flippase-like domain-containing protein [Deltaproteobacteria bacterium]|nr:flippase-like domain-containing protein [Deltaproteobacteria bacterium]
MTNLLKSILGCALIIILFQFVETESLIQQIQSVNLFKFLAFFFFSIPLIFISALKWHFLFKNQGTQSCFTDVLLYYFFAYAFSLLIPLGIVGADLARVQLAKKFNGYSMAIKTVFQDRYSGFLIMFFCSVFLSLISTRIPPLISLVNAIIFSVGILAPVIVKLIKFKKLAFFTNLMEFRLNKSLIYVLCLSLIFYLLAVVNILLGAWVLDIKLTPFVDLAALLPLVFLLSSIPISPQGLGVQEGFYFFLFQFVGANPTEALSLALLLRVKVILIGVLAWIVFYIRYFLTKSSPER